MKDRQKLSSSERLTRKEIFLKSRPAENVKRGDLLRGTVYNVTDEGAFVLTEDNYLGFIHQSEQEMALKQGMSVEGRVVFVRADGRVNLSLKPLKEISRVVDADKILNYLRNRNGSMPFNDSSPPDVIKERFGISKAAFKRAVGKLLKDGLVEKKEGWIILKEDPQP